MNHQMLLQPPLRLDIFELESVELQEFPRANNANVAVDVDFALVQMKTEDCTRLGIHLTLLINKNAKKPKLKGMIESVSFFSFEDQELEESQKAKLIMFQGFAMSYSLLRGIIFQKASSLLPTEKLLPTIHLKSLVDQKYAKETNTPT